MATLVLWLRSLLVAASTALVSSTCWGQSTSPTPPYPLPSRQEILRELATIQRMWGDELFIGGDRMAAKARYAEAASTAAQLSPDSGLLRESDIQLLRTEIDYRTELLQRNASFWGLQFATRPVNPVGAVRQFLGTFDRFKKAVVDIGSLADKLYDKNIAAMDVEDKNIQTDRDARVAELQQSIAEVRLKDASVRRAMLTDRKTAIQTRQAQLTAQINALRQEVDQRSASINSTLTNALVTATGVPPDTVSIVKGAAKGDVDAIVQSAVKQYVQSPDAIDGLPASLRELAQTGREATQKYEEFRRNVQDVQQRAEQGAQLLKAMQMKDRDQLLAVGSEALGKMAPGAKKQLLDGVGSLMTIDSVISLAGVQSAVRQQIEQYLVDQPKLALQVTGNLATQLRPGADLALRYQTALAANWAAATNQGERTAVLAAAFRAWPRSVVADVLGPQKAVQPLARALGANCADVVSCATWLSARLATSGLDGVTLASTGSGELSLRVNAAEVARLSGSAFMESLHGREIESQEADIKSDLDALAARLQKADAALVKEVMHRLSPPDFDRHIGAVLTASASDAARVLAAVNGSPDPATPSGASRDMAALSLGKAITAKTVFANVAAPTAAAAPAPAAAGPAAPGGANAPDPAQQIALGALKASGPYGFVAATAIELLSAVAQNGAAIDEINAKAREDHELTVEMLHIAVFEVDVQRDEAIAQLESRIASEQFSTARDRSDLFQQVMIDKGEQNAALQARIRRRLPLVYLLAEQLRQQFDSLDHSVGFWANDLNPESHFVERTLRADPQWRRFGLDPDIALYAWFKRDAEGQRRDLDALMVHWAGIEKLVHDTCASYHCDVGDSEMGQVEVTDRLSLRTLVGEDAWQAAAKTRQLQFTVLPASLPNLPQREGLRLVEVNGAVVERSSGAVTSDPNIVLRHSGLGYVVSHGTGLRETLETSGPRTPTTPIDDKGVDARKIDLQKRWATTPSMRPLEGYALFGIYQIGFPKNFNFASSDYVLRLFYQFPVNSTSLELQDQGIQFACSRGIGQRVVVDASEVSLLIARDVGGPPALEADPSCTSFVKRAQ